MQALNSFFERYFMPFATKLNSIKGLIAIRGCFCSNIPSYICRDQLLFVLMLFY